MNLRRRSTTPLPLLVLLVVCLVGFAGVLAAAAGPAPEPPQQPPANPSPQNPDDPTESETLPEQSDERFVIVLEDNQRPRIRLAFPEIEGVGAFGGEPGRAADLLDKTLRGDLLETRIFEIQGPWAFRVLDLTGDRGHDFEQYRSLGNEIVLQALVQPQRDRMVFEGRLYDLKSGQAILAKRYSGPLSSARRIAHTFADEVVEFLVGRRGIALTRIAFTTTRAGGKEVFVMDFDGANQRPVTAHRSTSMAPAWHPSGSYIAYTSFVGGPPGIYRAELATGRKTAILTDGEQNISPSYSPDGRRIVFSRALGANSEIFIADADGSNARRITHTQAIDASPAWSPTGSDVAFTSSRAGNPHVFLMDAEGSNVRRISHGGNYNDGAAWNAAGDRLAYATRRRGQFDIAVTDVATLETGLLTRGPGSHEEPTFSPDGRRIAFTSDRSGAKQIWVMDADGSNPRALTGEGRNESPAWSSYPPR
jgi:TolB protein